MDTPGSTAFVEAKARVIRAIKRLTSFVQTSVELNQDRSNVGKRAKLSQMLSELNMTRQAVENDIQIMESSVANKTAPTDVNDHTVAHSLIESFDSLYYELAAFSEVNQLSLSKIPTQNQSTTYDQSQNFGNMSAFQLPKRKFPTFSGAITEWQGFEDLFQSILSHASDLPDVERFEYLKTSLQGEPLSLIAHLPLTAANYTSAWEILRSRYGNKRDLARIHLDALLTPHSVKIDDAVSIKTVISNLFKHTAALDNLNFITRQWSPILVHILEKQLDYELRSRWELQVGDTVFPTLVQLIDFLRSHIRSAEIRSDGTNASKTHRTKSEVKKSSTHYASTQRVLTTVVSADNCSICKEPHKLVKCQSFIAKTPSERYQLVKDHRLCLNCLRSNHGTNSCKSKFTCRTCGQRHHSMLHFTKATPVNEVGNTNPQASSSSLEPVTTCLVSNPQRSVVLLATMLLKAKAPDETCHKVRALVDSGSEASFITTHCADKLSLIRRRCTSRIQPFSGSPINIVSGIATITLSAASTNDPTVTVNVMIVPKIIDQTPHSSLSSTTWSHLKNLPLADPTYNTPGQVDVLLGADIVPHILMGDRVTGLPSQPVAFNTLFGWIVLGPANQTTSLADKSFAVQSNEGLESALNRFWTLEEPSKPNVSIINNMDPAEQIFIKSITQTPSGRFCIRLPFKSPNPIIGDSKSQALHRFRHLEWRLSKDDDLRNKYVSFMQDYLDSNHMELVPVHQRSRPNHYYIPHHCILRPESQTTKLRVVFDASAKSSTGISLNDCLHTGPKLQSDLSHILLRSRVHRILFTADIKQMYRQIIIADADRDYLRILWRFNQQHPIEEYRLCTVTYGTSAAPYQAIRTLKHLAKIGKNTYPIASQVLQSDAFVDDILTGADSIQTALCIQNQLIGLLSSGQFLLRKWASNALEVVNAVPDEARSKSPSIHFDDESETGLKVLGLQWDPTHDHFCFAIRCLDVKPTKRNVLSEIARIFDPLGVLSPITFLTKHLMQVLWTAGIGWDDVIPTNAHTIWQQYRDQLPCLQELRIPRRITIDNYDSIELHAFSDSSEKGFAAVIYLRSRSSTGVICHLVTARTKVAPLKHVTIPRLELCGALLAATLLKNVRDVLSPVLDISSTYAWTDSMTALAWIKSSPHRWTTFVANRVSQIQDLTAPSIWRYVPTKENPADCASRGLFLTELLSHPSWWTGPAFLYGEPTTWPKPNSCQEKTTLHLESKPLVTLTTTNSNQVLDRLFERCSSLSKVIRIIGYCLRFKPHHHYTTTILTPKEQQQALDVIIMQVQLTEFHDEIRCLSTKQSQTSRLRRLSPFLDSIGILRVGGRLRHASLPYEQKHPVLIPKRHPFTSLLVHHYHQENHHPGPTTLQRLIQQRFWIISARQVIRSHLRFCIPCFRVRPKAIQPVMGNLPVCRLQQIKPFHTTGVDYAGPINLKERRTRGSQVRQAYICLFVCMSTKALHLEVASNLSTETFLMAFTRFAARRGPVQAIHSDCGTNFVGTPRLFSSTTEYQNAVTNHLSTQQIQWHFNPPSAPHFGGLWEAGVKTVKQLLYRSLGTHRLTMEELGTCLTRIEATLNSRPLGPMSDDPADFNALTPSHFLTLEPSTTIPDPDLSNVAISKLQRWRLIRDIHQHFWSTWQSDYLNTLQQRTKWTKPDGTLGQGDLVLIKEPINFFQWKLGRVVQLHPGTDGVNRVATIKTATGSFKRPTNKLCPLPKL